MIHEHWRSEQKPPAPPPSLEQTVSDYHATATCRLPDCPGCRERDQLVLRLTGELDAAEREIAVLRQNLRRAGWEEME